MTSNRELTPLVQVADCLPVALVGERRSGDAALRLARAGQRDRRPRGSREVGATDGGGRPGDRALLLRGRRGGPGTRSADLGSGCDRADARPARGRAASSSPRAGMTRSTSTDLCTSCEPDLFFSHRRDARAHGPTGRASVDRRRSLSRYRDIDPETVRRNLERVRERCGPGVEILAATKYVLVEELGRLAEAGVGLVGENRLQDLEAKRELYGDRFAWDFIGNLQSRKVKRIVPLVRLIHSVATDSALEQLGRHGGARDRDPRRGQHRRRGGEGWRGPGSARGVHRARCRFGCVG